MDFFDVVHTQRSIRRFKPDSVPDDALWKILDATVRAPSGSNLQPWIWLVVREQAKRQAIARAVRALFSTGGGTTRMRERATAERDPSQRRVMLTAADFFDDVAAAPVLIIPCLVGVTSPTTDARSLLAGSSIYGAVQNMMLAARAEGLGTVLTTFQAGIEDMLRREFHLPPEAVPVAVVPVGYPDRQRFGPTTRKPVDTVTYWDDWGATRKRGE
ncbi:MAG: nitroreductase family protein [Dehalococcoidia bacterium]|nr:nitroreductase family protein [Dehalococcoidia bacterium]